MLLDGLVEAFGKKAVAAKLRSERELVRIGFRPFALARLFAGDIPVSSDEAFDRHLPPGFAGGAAVEWSKAHRPGLPPLGHSKGQ